MNQRLQWTPVGRPESHLVIPPPTDFRLNLGFKTYFVNSKKWYSRVQIGKKILIKSVWLLYELRKCMESLGYRPTF